MKLLLFPLSFLVVCTLLSGAGITTAGTFDTTDNWWDSGHSEDSLGWYDVNGHLCLYVNGTVPSGCDYGSFGSGSIGGLMVRTWNNGTVYQVYNTADGQNAVADDGFFGFDLASSYGLLAVVGVLLFIGTIAGTRILGSGVSDTSVSVIVKGGFWFTIWAILSALTMTMFLSIPFVGGIFYFVLTVVYSAGVVSSIGGGGGD